MRIFYILQKEVYTIDKIFLNGNHVRKIEFYVTRVNRDAVLHTSDGFSDPFNVLFLPTQYSGYIHVLL